MKYNYLKRESDYDTLKGLFNEKCLERFGFVRLIIFIRECIINIVIVCVSFFIINIIDIKSKKKKFNSDIQFWSIDNFGAL